MILIDIPVVAYKTMSIEVKTGDEEHDRALEEMLKRDLKEYPYSPEHIHIVGGIRG